MSPRRLEAELVTISRKFHNQLRPELVLVRMSPCMFGFRAIYPQRCATCELHHGELELLLTVITAK